MTLADWLIAAIVALQAELEAARAEVARLAEMTGPDAVRDVACLITGRVVQAQRIWLADCCSCQVCQLIRERDEARAQAHDATVLLIHRTRERDEARAEVTRQHEGWTDTYAQLDLAARECDHLRALLVECRQVIEDYADPMWNEGGVLVWSLIAREALVKRLDAALERRQAKKALEGRDG